MTREVSEETRAKISDGLRRAWQRPNTRRRWIESRWAKGVSPAFREHIKSLHEKMRGKPLKHKLDALSSSMASRRLKAMGLSRKGNPELWKLFKERYLKELDESA